MDEYKSRLSDYLTKLVREELEKYDGGFTDEWNDQRKKNAEVLGYKLAGTSDISEGVKDPKLKVGQKIRYKKDSRRLYTLKKITHGNRGIPEDPAGTSYMFVAPGNRKEYHTKKTWAQAIKKGWLSLESVNEAKMTHVLTKDIGKKKMKDLEQYLWHVLELVHNKDFRLSFNGKILSVNVDKINRKSIQNIKKRYGVDLKESVNEEIIDWQGGYNDDFKFKKGQLVKDINPDCPHVGSEGEVTKVTKDEVTYIVRNNGKNYKIGDELTKTKDQLTPLSIEEKKDWGAKLKKSVDKYSKEREKDKEAAEKHKGAKRKRDASGQFESINEKRIKNSPLRRMITSTFKDLDKKFRKKLTKNDINRVASYITSKNRYFPKGLADITADYFYAYKLGKLKINGAIQGTINFQRGYPYKYNLRTGTELESINKAKRGTDLYFVIDQLVNSMEHYDEREFIKHIGKETKYSSPQLKKLYKSYYKLSPRKRFSMSFNWEKWLKNQGISEASERDYKAEYNKFQSSTKSKKYRAELNQYNRKKGTYGNNDGKDASHKGGKIVGFEKESTNRGRREKSRLKKEAILKLRQMIREELGLGDYND